MKNSPEVLKLMDLIQGDLPLCAKPFSKIAGQIQKSEDWVIEEIEDLKKSGVLSFLGPIYDTKAVGYRTSLVAIDCEDIEKMAEIVSSYPGVSHCYERNDELNLWFTLAVPPSQGLAFVVKEMVQRSELNCNRILLLPSLKRYKLRVHFAMLAEQSCNSKRAVSRKLAKKVQFGSRSVETLRIVQDGIPLCPRPFFQLMGNTEGEAELLERLKEDFRNGFIRRISALMKHRRMGFTANAMALWSVTPNRADEVGEKLASSDKVSHCYRRRRAPTWNFSHYAMVHGRSTEEVETEIRQLGKNIGVDAGKILYSIKEFKKRRLKLYTTDYETWLDERKMVR